MTVVFVGDPHVGNFSRHGGPKQLGMNRRCALTLMCLRGALDIALEERASHAVILGDLLDGMRPEPQLIDAVRSIFRQYTQHMKIVLLKGNHDSASDTPRDTALYAVQEERVTVIDEPEFFQAGNNSLLLVPFRSGPVISWLPDVLAAFEPVPDAVLCLHAGIKDEETAPWLQHAPDSIEASALSALMQSHEIELAFAGNWHEHLVWEKAGIHQVGALCPTGFSNLGVTPYGHVAILSDDDWEVRYRSVHGPRFVKLGPHESLQAFLEEADPLDRLYIEWKVPADRLSQAQAEVAQMVELGCLEAGSALPDTTGASESVKRAAQAARHAVGIEEAVAAFVSKVQIPGNADRDSIHARVRRYVGL